MGQPKAEAVAGAQKHLGGHQSNAEAEAEAEADMSWTLHYSYSPLLHFFPGLKNEILTDLKKQNLKSRSGLKH